MTIARRIARQRLSQSAIHRRRREAAEKVESVLAIDVDQYFDDPVGYAINVLGFDPWDDGSENSQLIIMAVAAFVKKLAVASGHKTGKSGLAACIALWWYHTRVNRGLVPRVVLTAPTDKQVGEVTWADIRRLYFNARVRIPGKLYRSQRVGLRGPNDAKILGYVAKSADAFSGPSSGAMLVIVDEAAGIDATIYEAIEGMAAGGATIIFLGNPTQVTGPFYDAFHKEREQWTTFRLSSRVVAAHLASIGRKIPGMATLEWVEERVKAWGPKDARTQVRVDGLFPSNDARSVVPLELIQRSQEAFRHVNPKMFEREPVELGIDVARFGDDKTKLYGRQGAYVHRGRTVETPRGSDIANAAVRWVSEMQGRLDGMIDTNLIKPVIRVDGNGVGATVVDALLDHAQARRFELVDVNASQSAVHPKAFTNARAEMAFRMRDFLERGGIIPDDEELREDLATTRYTFDRTGRLQIEDKAEIKKRQGRSPDDGDAAWLSVYHAAEVTGMTVIISGL